MFWDKRYNEIRFIILKTFLKFNKTISSLIQLKIKYNFYYAKTFIPKIFLPSLNLYFLYTYEPNKSIFLLFKVNFVASKFSFILSTLEVPGIGTTPELICQLSII